MDIIGPSEADPFWTESLRKLTRRGLRGVKLLISDAYEGLKAVITCVLCATGQRYRMHIVRNALAHAGRSGCKSCRRSWPPPSLRATPKPPPKRWRRVTDQLRPKLSKVAVPMDGAEADALAYVGFPDQHHAKLHSTTPLERLNGEVKHRTEVVGIFPNEAAISQLVGAILLQQKYQGAAQHVPP